MATKSSKKSGGHGEHTKSAAMLTLPGEIQRPIKITMFGAGSGFTPRLVNDVLKIKGNKGGVIALVDIDRKRLPLTDFRHCTHSAAPPAGVASHAGPQALASSRTRRM